MKKIMMLLCCLSGSSQALEVLLTDQQNQPIKGAAVWLEGDKWPIKQTFAPQVFSMGQRDRAFTPHLLVVPQGAQVEFPNYDSILHHVYSFSQAKPFELKLYRDKPQAPVGFTHTGVVELGCNIHDWMLGYILVVNSGVFGISDEQGRVKLDMTSSQLGNGQLHVWHERFENLNQPEVSALTVTGIEQVVHYQVKQPLLENQDFLTDETDEYE
jgi:plastocyanin